MVMEGEEPAAGQRRISPRSKQSIRATVPRADQLQRFPALDTNLSRLFLIFSLL